MPTVQVQILPATDIDVKDHATRLGIKSKADFLLVALEEYLEKHAKELKEFREKYAELLQR